MLRLYITRHGETQWNVENRVQSWLDSDLTEKGERDALKLKNYIEDIDFHRIYSSTSGRAFRTAQIIKGDRPLIIETVEALRELNMGIWSGKTESEVAKLYSEDVANFKHNTEAFRCQAGESFEGLFDRVSAFFDFVVEENQTRGEERNILIVTHAITLKAMINVVMGSSVKDFWQAPKIDGTSLTIVEIDDDNRMSLLAAGYCEYLYI